MVSERLSEEQLVLAADELAAQVAADPRCARLTDVLVARGGSTVRHHSSGPAVPRDLFSVTKTVLALMVGVAAGDRLVGTHVDVAHFLPELAGPGVARRTVAHLLTMRRGAQTGGRYDLDEVAVHGGSWAARFAEAPEVEEPGTRFRYDNGASQLLAEVLHRVTGDLAAYAERRLFEPLGSPTGAGFGTPRGRRPAPGTWR